MPPGGADAAVIDLLQLLDPVVGVDAYPPKSGQPEAPVVPVPRLVLVSLAGRVPLQAPPGPAVEGVMHGEEVGPDLFGLPADGLRQAFHFPSLPKVRSQMNPNQIARVVRTHRILSVQIANVFRGLIARFSIRRRMHTWTDGSLKWWANNPNYIGPILGLLITLVFVWLRINAADELKARADKIRESADEAARARITAVQQEATTANARANDLAEDNQRLAKRVTEAELNAARAKSRTDKRGFTASERSAFLAILSPSTRQDISVYHDARDSEASNFANIVSEALNASGAGFGENSGIQSREAPEGIWSFCANPANPPQLAGKLIRAFERAGQSASLGPAPGWAVVGSPGWVGVWIGIKPRD